MQKKSNLNKIIVIGLLIAVEIILTRLLSINFIPSIRIGFGFLPVALTAIMFGPYWAAASYALGDVIGIHLFPVATAPPFYGFTITAFLTGLIFGFSFHKKLITYKRVFITALIVCIPLNLGLDTYWLSLLMNKGFLVLLPVRIIKVGIHIILQTLLIPTVWNRLKNNNLIKQAIGM